MAGRDQTVQRFSLDGRYGDRDSVGVATSLSGDNLGIVNTHVNVGIITTVAAVERRSAAQAISICCIGRCLTIEAIVFELVARIIRGPKSIR